MKRVFIDMDTVPVDFQSWLDQVSEEVKARQIQAERFSGQKSVYCNAQMTSRLLNEFVRLDSNAMQRLHDAMVKFDLSARAYERILKVARTIADLAGSEEVKINHVNEAIGYRNLDRGTWGEKEV